MIELKDRAQEYLEGRGALFVRPHQLIKDQLARITELEAAIENHLKYPLMGSKELKEVLSKP